MQLVLHKTAYEKAQTASDDEDSARKDYRQAKLTYEQSIKGYIHTAQSNYVTYLSSVSARELQENTVKAQERDAQVDKMKYEKGFLSKNEYTSSLLDNTSENNTLSKLKNAEELAKLNLCTSLGISSGENITFSTDIKEDLNKVFAN